MYKVYSLDYINSEIFETDIINQDGKILYPAGTKITPELLLKLYFKDIYTNQEPEKKQIEILPEEKPIEVESETYEENKESSQHNFDVDENGYIIFCENQAERVSELALLIGKELKYNEEQLDKLRQGAYYHSIGITKFKPEDLRKKDFKKLFAQAGYDILLNQKKMPEEIALCAKLWMDNYDLSSFNLEKIIPNHHIIAIAHFYDRLLTQKIQKEKILEIMLQCGGYKFNIYVLHKFIRIMRGLDG